MDPTPPSADEQLSQAAWVRRLARNILRDPGLAEDAVQEGAIAAWRHGPLDSHAYSSWLATTIRRLAGRFARGEARRSARERAAARDEALPSAAELVERAEAHRALVAAVLALEEPYRSTILLRYVEDLPPRAIARRANVPVATVKTRLARGLDRLRKDLEREHRDAREWLGLLVPLSPTFPAPPLVLGTTLVKSLKLTAAALLVLLVAVGLVWIAQKHPSVQPAASIADQAASTDSDQSATQVESPTAGRDRLGLTLGSEPGPPVEGQLPVARETLHGRVLDSRDRPIAGAEVRALRSLSAGYEIFDAELVQAPIEAAVEHTDALGRFEVELDCGTLVDLLTHADGYADEKLGAKFGAGEVVIHLDRSAVLLGDVTRSDDGTPVAGALVRVSCGNEDAIELLAHTDALGHYRFDGLTPGRIGMIVAPVGECLSAWLEQELRPGETFRRDFQVRSGERVRGRVIDAVTGAGIPGASVSASDFIYKTSLTDAHGEFEIGGLSERQLRLAVRAQGYGRLDQQVLDFAPVVELALQPGRQARGRVLGPNGEPVAGAFVAAVGLGERGTETRTSASSADGRFELSDLRLDVEHVLLVRAERFGTSFRPFPAGEMHSGGIDLGDVRLERAAFLEGRAWDDSGKVRAGITVELTPTPSAPELRSLAQLHGRRTLETDSTGRFVFRDLGTGEWTLAARGSGLVPSEPLALRLEPGEVRRGLEIRLRLGLAIEGLVRDMDGHPLQGAWVSAVAEDRVRGRGAVATDETGHFSVTGLPAGNFTIDVIGPGSDFEWRGRFEALRLRRVQAGCAALDVRLRERSSSIRGRVLDADGVPLEGAFVWELSGEGIPPKEFVLSGAEGRFELAVPAGSTVQLMARRGMPLVQSLRTPTHGEVRAGRVMLDDPEPMAVSTALGAGSEGVELKIPRER